MTQRNRRILIIDDNEAIHGDFKKILAGGAAAATASGSTSASSASSKLAGTKAALFGDAAANGPAPTRAEAAAEPFELDSALQGQQGLEKLNAALQASRPYAVAFVDMRMPPGWDGLQTIQRLWAVDPNLQVVICTAYSDHSWQEISTQLGLTDRLLILKKPFDPVEVYQLAIALSEKWALRLDAKLKMDQLEHMVQQRTRELTELALHDRLTGLPNRMLLNDRLTQAVQRHQRDTANHHFAVLFLDFDRFKIVNDSLGHEMGDRLLVEIGKRLSDSLRSTDTVAPTAPVAADSGSTAARLGGDEFVILLDGLAATADAARIAERLLKTLGEPYQLKGHEVSSTASIGITTSDIPYESAAEVLRDADTAMYHAKAAGKARFVIFDRKMHEEVMARLALENDLRRALERGEMFLHYQPVMSLATGRIEGMEALLRWRHPARGVVPPGDFIGCVEETGMILGIGAWVLQQACRQLRAWQMRFGAQIPDFFMSVNVSARQLSTPGLVGQVSQILRETGVPPQTLALEITESVMIRDAENAVRVMRELRELGVRLQMDDFGTGYSSLSCLHQFPLNCLKIDRSFIENLGERRDYAAVVQAIIQLARNLGMQLVAEGIERPEQVAMLQAMECDRAQGYLFSRPVDVQEAEAFIRSRLAKPAAAA
jgi:diguanylate cyclase (GGDEF)-like protein